MKKNLICLSVLAVFIFSLPASAQKLDLFTIHDLHKFAYNDLNDQTIRILAGMAIWANEQKTTMVRGRVKTASEHQDYARTADKLIEEFKNARSAKFRQSLKKTAAILINRYLSFDEPGFKQYTQVAELQPTESLKELKNNTPNVLNDSPPELLGMILNYLSKEEINEALVGVSKPCHETLTLGQTVHGTSRGAINTQLLALEGRQDWQTIKSHGELLKNWSQLRTPNLTLELTHVGDLQSLLTNPLVQNEIEGLELKLAMDPNTIQSSTWEKLRNLKNLKTLKIESPSFHHILKGPGIQQLAPTLAKLHSLKSLSLSKCKAVSREDMKTLTSAISKLEQLENFEMEQMDSERLRMQEQANQFLQALFGGTGQVGRLEEINLGGGARVFQFQVTNSEASSSSSTQAENPRRTEDSQDNQQAQKSPVKAVNSTKSSGSVIVTGSGDGNRNLFLDLRKNTYQMISNTPNPAI